MTPYQLGSVIFIIENDLYKYEPSLSRHKNLKSEQYKFMGNLKK